MGWSADGPRPQRPATKPPIGDFGDVPHARAAADAERPRSANAPERGRSPSAAATEVSSHASHRGASDACGNAALGDRARSGLSRYHQLRGNAGPDLVLHSRIAARPALRNICAMLRASNRPAILFLALLARM